VSGNELDARCGHLVRDRHRLLRIAGIVAGRMVELLAEHAARGIDVLDSHLAAVLHLRTEGGVLTGDRPDDRNRSGVVLLAAAAAGQDCGYQSDEQPGNSLHRHLPSGTRAQSTASGKSASARIGP
jgi:hypothetical protein